MYELEERRGVIDRLTEENEALTAEIAGLRARLAELEHLADTDTLVPLLNRRAFERELARVIAGVGRYGHSAAVLFVDLCGLKAINDRHGHQAGDAVLGHVAAGLTSNLRASDRVGRIGGDEFCMILDHLDEADASAKVKALVDGISNTPCRAGGAEIEVKVTAGLAMVDGQDSVEAVLSRADKAMYAQRSER